MISTILMHMEKTYLNVFIGKFALPPGLEGWSLLDESEMMFLKDPDNGAATNPKVGSDLLVIHLGRHTNGGETG